MLSSRQKLNTCATLCLSLRTSKCCARLDVNCQGATYTCALLRKRRANKTFLLQKRMRNGLKRNACANLQNNTRTCSRRCAPFAHRSLTCGGKSRSQNPEFRSQNKIESGFAALSHSEF